MNNEKDLLDHYNLKTNRISYKRKTKVVDTEKGKYVIKLKNNNNYSIYEYLQSRNFHNFLPLENKHNDPYEIYHYVEDRISSPSDKAIDLVYTLSMLHIKTTTYEPVNLDKVKEIYEETLEKINYLNLYYHDLQDYIEGKVYMAPAEYLLIRNMSQIYSSLEYSKNTLEEWYKIKEKQKKERIVLLHNNITLDHFLEEEQSYFINWDKSSKGTVVYDFLSFYQNEYQDLEMESLFEIYQSKYQYTLDEKLLFLALLAIPWKIELRESNYCNSLRARKLVNYVSKTRQLISKENEKYQKTEEQEFEQ